MSRFDAVYHEIVDGVRLVCSYEMRMDGIRLSVSLTSIELAATPAGTLLTLTEHGVYLDGIEDPALREDGTRQQYPAGPGLLPRHPAASENQLPDLMLTQYSYS